MTKTIHPLLSHYSSTKWGEGRGRLFERGAHFKFRPIGGALIRGGGGGGGGGALIRRFAVFTPKEATKVASETTD